ncbi:hypothetical protein CKM354_000814500 [Cercospora kikuchii]|uniref:Polyadenylation factor subunit 2 n=1 Tax=Cercospora kikuchii TaxID=84275 RepID=A0A9P3CMB2_9PEZI|nr:uncharacterized protein CKM354_000814500 [Cercospora kikuchii]GIZ44961.1 hypothetical protein CKM354_000814500 [Cercospora kikuchii]
MDREAEHGGFDQPRPRGRPSRRNATDIGNTYVHFMHDRRSKASSIRGFEAERPTLSYAASMVPPAARKGNAADSLPAKHLHTSFNKHRHPVNVVKWTPDGRRLLTGATSGEFTLWNGTGFNFETIMQAHEAAVRSIVYSHSDDWLISADQEGLVKYWQPNFNNVKEIQAHDMPVRDMAFAPQDSKFVTASDDASLKIFDFASGEEISKLDGHQWDVKAVDWHPSKGLLVSGSKDHNLKLWDPRSGRCLTTLHGHKNTVNMTKFEPSRGALLASCARDQTVRIFDIHMMRDVFLLKGNEKEITSIVWHPIHSSMLSTGAADGAVFHYLLDEQNPPPGTAITRSPYDAPNPADAPAQTLYPSHRVTYAHEFNVWSMDWHPMGHILATGSNDRATRFWTRPRPGEGSFLNDKWHIGQTAAEEKGTWKRNERQMREEEDAEEQDEADGLEDQKMPSRSALPGLPGLAGLPGLGSAMPSPDNGMLGAAPSNFPMPNPATAGMPFAPPPPGSLPPGMDMAAFQQALSQGQIPPGFPPLPPNGQMPPGFAPPPGMPGMPPGFPPPANGFPGMPAPSGSPPNASGGAGSGSGIRRRAPLPDQADALKQEMAQGRYLKPR